jgi:UDP-N-acetylglucosamine transferase subunit ALG13
MVDHLSKSPGVGQMDCRGTLVFVTVGNATQKFGRLLNEVERLAGEGFFDGELVLIQTGNNPEFQTRHCQQAAFLTQDEFRTAIREADVVIAHAGAGTLCHAADTGKIPVVMPRRAKYGEHIDDHQVELAHALAANGTVISVDEPMNLAAGAALARHHHPAARRRIPPQMAILVEEAVQELLNPKPRIRRGLSWLGWLR